MGTSSEWQMRIRVMRIVGRCLRKSVLLLLIMRVMGMGMVHTGATTTTVVRGIGAAVRGGDH